ncbi:MAG: MBL fold metallo-hydrolase [Ruminococcaceae bacterium]|nr:MBL fold metallo-hydrolase [Oscillospiraceae bacterium]
MKKLSLFILLISLLCCVALFAACDTGSAPTDPCAGGHTEVADAAVDATCTATGLSAGSHCSVCHKVLTAQEVIPAKGHTEGKWTVQLEPSCTGKGSQYSTCTVCGEVASIVAIDALGHEPNEWTVLIEPTCTSTGERETTCKVCDAPIKEITPFAEHTLSNWINDLAPSCLGEGYRHQNCFVCNQVAKVEVLPAKGHSFGEWKTLNSSTCSKQGEEGRICTVCGVGERRLLPLAEHTPASWTTDLQATCLSKGAKHQSCKHCNAVVAVEEIPQASHVAAASWTVVTAPTATKAGTSTLCCIYCDTVLESCATSLVSGAISLNKPASVTLTGYAIVYPIANDSTPYFRPRITALSAAIKSATGSTAILRTDDSSIVSKEILVGLTNREESIAAYNSLQGRSFTIRVIGDKIVIVGSDELMTTMAVQYFIHTYLGGTASTLSLSENTTAYDVPVMSLANGTGTPFVYVMDADLDNDPLHMYVTDSYNNPGYSGDGRDYPSYLFEDLLARISLLSGTAEADLKRITDADTTYQNGYELLFGEVDRAESRAFRDELDGNEYGFYITDKKVIVTAHTDAGLERAKDAFLTFYAYVISCNGGLLPQGYRFVDAVTDEGWMMNFPRPDNVTIYNAQNNNDDSLQMVYTGTGANVSGYLAYCQKLEAAGYVLVTKNDNAGGKGSYFRTYKNTAKGHALYVAYNAFSAKEDYAANYAAEQKVGTQYGDFIHYFKPNTYNVYYPLYDYEQCIRVVTAPLDSAYLPTADILQDTYNRATDKICESSVTTLRLMNGDVGMCYILQLEDGSFVIVDGGSYHAENKTKEILYATLAELHKRVYGTAPSASNPIHITAWLITHSHGDHYVNANNFLATYVPQKLIKMDYLVGNFPERSTIYPVAGDTVNMGSGTLTKMLGYFTTAGLTPCKYVKVHTGMTLYFANLKMEILMTYEDHAPYRINNSNDTNTVTKWTISSANKDTTWMMLGDSCIYQSRWLCAMWGGSYNTSTKLYDGSYMQTDMVQLAHHGNIGCEVALYKSIQPTVVFFPHNHSSYNSYTQNGTNTWQRHVDSYVINSMSSVKYIVVAGMNSTSTSYTDSITISFNANGIYFPSSGNPAWGIKYNKTTGAVTVANIAYNSSYYGTRVSGSPVIKK